MRWSYLALVLLLPLPVRAQERTQLPPPDSIAHEILLRGDTVWFVPPAPLAQYPHARALGYVKSGGSWIEGMFDVADDSLVVRDYIPDTTRLWPGIYLVHVRDTVVQDAELFASPVYAVWDSATGRLTPLLIPDIPANRLRAFAPGEDATGGDFGTLPSSWVTEGEHAWFALWGGTPYRGDPAEYRQMMVPTWLGALLLYERRTGRLTPLIRPELRTRWVSALAFAGDALWIAPHYEPFALDETDTTTIPLLRFTPADSSWRAFRGAASPVPGSSISYLQADGDLLLISADSGVAVLDTHTGRSSARWFDTLVRNDSVVTIYLAARPRPDSTRDAAIALAGELGEKRLSALLAAARQLLPANYREYLESLTWFESPSPNELPRALADRLTAAGDALGHPVFLPFLARAFRQNDYDSRDVAREALLRIHDPAALALLHEAFASPDVARGALVAGPLAARGDAQARAWLHARLAEAAAPPRSGAAPAGQPAGSDTTAWDERHRLELLVDAVSVGHDSAAVPLLLRVATGRNDGRAALGALRLGTMAQKRQLIALLPAHAPLWYPVLDTLAPRNYDVDENGAPRDTRMRDSLFAAGLTALARTVLGLPDSALTRAGVQPLEPFNLRTNAISVLSYSGEPRDVPLLMGLLGQKNVSPSALAEGLVLLTGVDGAPGVSWLHPTPEQVTVLRRFWSAWWAAHRASFRVPPLLEREQALQRWLASHNLSEQ